MSYVGPFKTVTICGSMRFKDEMLRQADRLSRDGHIVLFPFVTFTAEEQANGHPDKVMLDRMRLAKIDRSAFIHVVNVGGYIGASTRGEIDYAKLTGKPVVYTEGPK
jgi:hypothetical protein